MEYFNIIVKYYDLQDKSILKRNATKKTTNKEIILQLLIIDDLIGWR